jgi:hypothetical protein
MPPQPQKGLSFIDLLMKWGIAKTPQGAHNILVVFIIVCLAITFYTGYNLVVDTHKFSAAEQKQLIDQLEAPARRHNVQIQ